MSTCTKPVSQNGTVTSGCPAKKAAGGGNLCRERGERISLSCRWRWSRCDKPVRAERTEPGHRPPVVAPLCAALLVAARRVPPRLAALAGIKLRCTLRHPAHGGEE